MKRGAIDLSGLSFEEEAGQARRHGCGNLGLMLINSRLECRGFESWCHKRLRGCGSPVVKVSDHGRHVMSSSPVPLKTRHVEQRCTLNLARAEAFSRWCGVVVRRGGASSGVVHVT
ncbi:uncharacterized protein TNCV_113711 [Trichonephila clavipes]|nr:uncharacterized protein TNCV_113711 [Trichonephila clavipes]